MKLPKKTIQEKKRRNALAVHEMIFNKTIQYGMVFLGMLAFNVQGNQPSHTLDDLAKTADVIVYGKIKSISKDPAIDSRGAKIYAASISVETCFKRLVSALPQEKNEIKFMYLTGTSEHPALEIGKNYFLFFKESDIGPYPLDGVEGVVYEKNNKVMTALIDHEPAEPELNAFKEKLLISTKRFGCDDWY